jgi:hypothetical protein
MIPVILAEGLAILRSAYNAYTAIQMGETVVSALKPREMIELSRHDAVEDEEQYFYAVASAVHYHLRLQNDDIPFEPLDFINANEEALYEQPLFSQALPDAVNKVSAWMATFAKIMASQYPQYEDAFRSVAEKNLLTGEYQTDLIRHYFSVPENTEKFKSLMKELGYDEEKTQLLVRALNDDAEWDQPTDHGEYVSSTLLAMVAGEYRSRKSLQPDAVGPLFFNTSYLPVFSGSSVKDRLSGAGRYQKYTVTRKDIDEAEQSIRSNRETLEARFKDVHPSQIPGAKSTLQEASEALAAAGILYARKAAIRKLERLRKRYPATKAIDKKFVDAIKIALKYIKK